MLGPAFALFLLAGPQATDIQISETARGYVYVTSQAVVQFDRGSMSAAGRLEFVRLVDRGISDVSEFVNIVPSGKLSFSVRHRTRMSRAYGSRISLPYRRGESRPAPYLHETVHALLGRFNSSPATWLSEGFASYVESYIAENFSGYNAGVFLRGGNLAVDAAALEHLKTSFGQAAFRAIGTRSVPESLDRDRESVAPPFYVLSQSFVKYLVDNAGLRAVVQLHRTSATVLGGRVLSDWKRHWRASLDR